MDDEMKGQVAAPVPVPETAVNEQRRLLATPG
jgi:hypothetical protein